MWCSKIQLHRSLDSKPPWKHFGDRKEPQSKTYINHILKTNNSPKPTWILFSHNLVKKVSAEIKGSSVPGPIHPQTSYSSRAYSLTLHAVGARVPGPQWQDSSPIPGLRDLFPGTPRNLRLSQNRRLTLFSSCCLAWIWILFVLSPSCPKPPLVDFCPDFLDHSQADPACGWQL